VLIDLDAVRSELAEMSVDITNELIVLTMRDAVPRRTNIDQPPDESRLGVRNMDRRVGAHEDHAVELHLVSRLELLIDGHLLVWR